MAEEPAAFETQNFDFMFNMNRLQKYSSAAAAKKAAAELRAQLHQELESKKLCAYQPHECTQFTLEGYNYCLRHILEDKNAPYRQCIYVYNNNGKRCHLPAPKGDKKDHNGYCSDHALQTHLTRVRAGSRHQPATSAETLLNSLSHYVTPQRSGNSNNQEVDEDKTSDGQQLKVTKSLDPFTEIDAQAINASCSDVLEYASESESDVEPATFNTVWHDAQADSSDDESIDSENEDILKHAGIFTAEEVTLVTRDKLIRLQSLYIAQFKHLQYTLKERRRKYLASLKREKETLASIHNQPKDTPKEQRLYNKLKALNHYHRKSGLDAIMSRKNMDRRAKVTEGINPKPQIYTKCTFSEGGVKCGERSLPVARHCRKHILSDPNQILFKRCQRMQADIECNEPVLGIFRDATCKYHMEIPPIRNYGETRTFEDSDMEDSSDTHDHHMEMLASSSSDSKTPATITSQTMNFSNQFPSQFKTELFDSKEMFDMDNTSQDYIKQVSNEIDVTSVDETVPFGVFSGQEESDNSTNQAMKIEDLDNETVDTELSVVDPDDDMAGIMLELQKDSQVCTNTEVQE